MDRQDIKKVLLIGDYRMVNNYGAKATSEALIDLINRSNPNIMLKTIDFFRVNGIANREEKENRKRAIKGILQRLKILNLVLDLQQKARRKEKPMDNIPLDLDQYQEVLQEVKKGNICKYESDMLEWADVILINGEGNLVKGTDEKGVYRRGGRYLLFIAYLTRQLYQKPCYIINHTVDPQNNTIWKIIRTVYPMMTGIYVREQMSGQLLQQCGVKFSKCVPDALWSHNFEQDSYVRKPKALKKFDERKPYICIGDSSGMYSAYGKTKWNLVEVYTVLIQRLKKIYPRIIFVDGFGRGNADINRVVKKNGIPAVHIENCNYHELYFVLKNAKIFISGRWHTSIISLLAHTPILLWGADSHKTEALYKEIGYKYDFFPLETLPQNIDRIVEESKKICESKHNLVWEKVEELKKRAELNVDML